MGSCYDDIREWVQYSTTNAYSLPADEFLLPLFLSLLYGERAYILCKAPPQRFPLSMHKHKYKHKHSNKHRKQNPVSFSYAITLNANFPMQNFFTSDICLFVLP